MIKASEFIFRIHKRGAGCSEPVPDPQKRTPVAGVQAYTVVLKSQMSSNPRFKQGLYFISAGYVFTISLSFDIPREVMEEYGQLVQACCTLCCN